MDMAKISPEAQTQAAFIQLQTTGHSLKMGAPSTENWAQVPSPAQHRPAQLRPDQARRLFNRSLHGQTKSQAQRCQWQEAGALAGLGAGAVEGGSEEPKNGFYWRVC